MKLLSIQYLRGFAAVSVVVFHATLIANETFYPVPVAHFAAAGVDVFFVISGFIMWVTARNQNPLVFLRNRIRRIVPLYWMVTIGLYTAWIAAGHPAPDLLSLAKSLFFFPYKADNGLIQPVIVAGWTLNYEMFFYALFALSLLFGRAVSFILLHSIGALVLLGAYYGPGAASLQVLTSPLLLEFLCGVTIAIIYGLIGVPHPLLGVGFLLAGATVLILSEAQAPMDNSFWRVVIWGMPAASIVIGGLAFEGIVRSRILTRLGDASYSIYLTHALVISGVKHGLLTLSAQGEMAALILVVGGSVSSVIVGLTIYRRVEHPMLRLVVPEARSIELRNGRAVDQVHVS